MLKINLNEILSNDQTVSTKVLNHPNWINNRIIKVENEIIQIEFKNEYLKLLLTVGDTINIKLEHNKIEFIIRGFVENVIFSTLPIVIVRVSDIITHHNIRNFIRSNINLLCKIVPTTEEFKIQGITTDISEGGISMISYADFNVKDSVIVEIITSQNDILKFKGNIKRLEAKVNSHIQYGIEIVEIDNENKTILNKILANAENNM